MEYLICGVGGLSLSAITYLYMNKKINKIVSEKNNLILENTSTLKDKEKEYLVDTMNKTNELKDMYNLKINELEMSLSTLNVQMEEQTNTHKQQVDFLSDNKEAMLLQFKDLSEKIAEKQSLNNKEHLSSIINPFKEQLDGFKQQIDTVYDRESKDRSMLKQELMDLKELNKSITEETNNLTRALKGENKTMGNWGEMILEKVLEMSGLRIDKEYTREVSLKTKSGDIYRPDVVVHLPNARDVIIDAKTSLVSYERYINSNDREHLLEHIKSIDNHIKGLSDKKYTKLEGLNSLNFIFMFLPIESSLTMALEEDPELFNRAYKNNIFLVSPSSLLIGLKSIENTWKHKKQEDNVNKIVNKAGSLYDKFVGFVSDIEKVSDQFNTANKTLDLAKNKLYEGKGNLVTQIEQLKDMGANTTKSIEEKK